MHIQRTRVWEVKYVEIWTNESGKGGWITDLIFFRYSDIGLQEGASWSKCKITCQESRLSDVLSKHIEAYVHDPPKYLQSHSETLWDSLPFVDNRPLNLRWDAMLLRPRGRWIRTKYWRWRRFFDERPTLDVVVASGLRSSGRTSGIRNRNDMENGVILHKNLLLISAWSRCSNECALNYCLVVSKIYNLVI